MANFREKLKSRAGKLKTELPALYLAFKHKDTPASAKILAAVTLAYALSPVDLIPDFIPVLGYLDDLVLLPLLLWLTLRRIPPHVMEQCRQDAQGLWQNGKPKRWFYALPIVGFWVFIIGVIVKNVLPIR